LPPTKSVPSLTSLTFWLLAGKTVSFILTLALPLLLVRRLSQEEFGVYKQAFLVVNTAIGILPLGFQMSAYYFLPRETDRRGHVMLNILVFHAFTTGLGCLTLFLFPKILQVIFHSPDLVVYSPLIGLVVLLWGVGYFLETAAVANQESRMAAGLIIAAQLSKTVLLVGAAAAIGSVRSLIYAAILQGVVQIAILLVYLESRFPGFWRQFEWAMMRRQLSYALPFGLAGLLYTLEMDYHNYFVSHQFGAAVFAIYAIGCVDLPLVNILNESVGSVLIPRMSALQRENNTREMVLLTARVMRKLALVYFPLYAFLMLAGREFIAALFTARYAASWPIMMVNLTLLPFAIVSADSLARAYAGQRHYLLKIHLMLFPVMVISLWFATNWLGLIGAIWVVVISSLAGRFIMALRMGRVIGVRRSDIVLLKGPGLIAIAAGVAAAVCLPVRNALTTLKPAFSLAICAVCYGLVYFFLIVLMKIPAPDEWEFAQRYFARLRRIDRTKPASS
jgi:O-antigen/teichoic acid export membrane protein